MSPSRGTLLRLLNLGKGVNSHHGNIQHRNFVSTIRSSHQSHSLTLPNKGNLGDFDAPVAEETRETNFCTGESNDELHPDGIDSTLFEPTNGEYQDSNVGVRTKVASWHTNPSDLLSRLIYKNTEDATTTLRELKKLQNELEPRIEFARPARHCASEEDYHGCLSWIDVLPSFYDLDQPVLMSEGYDHGCQDIANTLNLLTNSRAEPYLVCLALLKIIKKGYLGAGDPVNNAIRRTMKWLVRHGKVLKDEDADLWTWQLWQSVSKFAARAKLEEKSAHSTEVGSQDDMGLEYELTRLYNDCIRTLCLAGNYEAAMIWVKNSCYLNPAEASRGTRLQCFTWKIFLEEILDRSSLASPNTRSQVGALAAEMQKRADLEPEVENLQALVRIISKIDIERNADSMSIEADLDEKVEDFIDGGDRKGAISCLVEALLEDERKSRWSHLPKASTLTNLREAIMANEDLEEQEELDAYLKGLTSSKGGKGLVPLSRMLQLSNNEFHADCVSTCLTNFQCRDLEDFALLVDKERFSNDIIKAKATKKYNENKYASYLALKSLLYHCQNDFDKIYKIYQTWLEMISHHRRDGDAKEAVDFSNDDVFEEVDEEYLFISDADTYTEEAAAKLSHKTPPNSRPSIYHFNLFLRILPKALGVHNASMNNSNQKTAMKSSNYGEESINLAFQIMNEMQRYPVEPNTSTWSILLSFLARNMSINPMYNSSQSTLPKQDNNGQANKSRELVFAIASEEEKTSFKQKNQSQWNRIWNLTSALGMGPEHLHTSYSPLPRATALTYSSLIYAFLKVPKSRGGPCLDEASQVKKWLLQDQNALKDLKRYSKPVTRVLNLLETVINRHHENKLKKKRVLLHSTTVTSTKTLKDIKQD